ncbi:unnamed protein product [Aureobasidium uvarum]|uniref:Uncharacterized protein n=1 Tax=Aureobasidium uvarum TaxID=2773716 RepID=A0A9N8KLD7_9PEZI|nr:unnamed protein product [Aureobasidium uvarum]
MTPLEVLFDEEDVSTWTFQSLRSFVGSSKKKLKVFYMNFFAWTEEDDDDDDGYQVLNKRPRTSSTPFPNTTSMSMPPSPSATTSGSQASWSMKLPNMNSIHNGTGKASSQITTAQSSNAGGNNSVGLIIFITRVAIVDQALVLERDRFGIVDNLFERGRLIEPYVHELVFGNPLDDKPTFLWFFDDTSDDKPRRIRNKPSLEAAIVILKSRAERAEATGIQVFDAPDRVTAALVPIHEVTRKVDFVQRVSFELEIDNGEESCEDECNKKLGADIVYESRNGELQLDHQPVKEEIDIKPDIKPDITWERQPQVDVESESESEEE